MPIVITEANLSKGYYTGDYLQHKPGLVCAITGDTTHEEALDQLEQLLDAWHKKKYPHLQESTAGITEIPTQHKENREQAKGEIVQFIQAATTMAELMEYKLLASTFPEGITAYLKRIQELSI